MMHDRCIFGPAGCRVTRGLCPVQGGMAAPWGITSPAEQRTPIFDGPAAHGAYPSANAAAWEMLAHRHPWKYRRAMRYMAWLNRMQNYYLRRVNL